MSEIDFRNYLIDEYQQLGGTEDIEKFKTNDELKMAISYQKKFNALEEAQTQGGKSPGIKAVNGGAGNKETQGFLNDLSQFVILNQDPEINELAILDESFKRDNQAAKHKEGEEGEVMIIRDTLGRMI